MARSIAKILSENDTGENGTHQAGILVPKDDGILGFFPNLDGTTYNPRACIDFHDENGAVWRFSFIYYNNKFFGGTRNEYRLTGMTKFMREHGAHCGDILHFTLDDCRRYHIKLETTALNDGDAQLSAGTSPATERVRINAAASWKVIDF